MVNLWHFYGKQRFTKAKATAVLWQFPGSFMVNLWHFYGSSQQKLAAQYA